jgi:hypothetical protein
VRVACRPGYVSSQRDHACLEHVAHDDEVAADERWNSQSRPAAGLHEIRATREGASCAGRHVSRTRRASLKSALNPASPEGACLIAVPNDAPVLRQLSSYRIDASELREIRSTSECLLRRERWSKKKRHSRDVDARTCTVEVDRRFDARLTLQLVAASASRCGAHVRRATHPLPQFRPSGERTRSPLRFPLSAESQCYRRRESGCRACRSTRGS